MVQNFSRRLETAIASSGKSKGALAKHCGVALSTVSRWLDGSVPKNEGLLKICEFLEVDPVWLLTGVEVMTREDPPTVLLDEPPAYERILLERARPNPGAPQNPSKRPLEDRIDRLEVAVERMAVAFERLADAMEKKIREGGDE